MFDRLIISTAILLFGIAAGSAARGADEQPSEARTHREQQITVQEVPALAKSSLDKLVEGVAVISYQKLTFKGKPAYSADITGEEKGTVMEYVVSENGSFLRKHLHALDGSPIDKKKKGEAKPAKAEAKAETRNEAQPAVGPQPSAEVKPAQVSRRRAQ